MSKKERSCDEDFEKTIRLIRQKILKFANSLR